jgi:hypothetical protein
MENYNITPAIISDHLSSLNFTNDKSNILSSISPAIKSKLTRSYNKRHEDTKLEQQNNKAKVKVDHIKYDPVL